MKATLNTKQTSKSRQRREEGQKAVKQRMIVPEDVVYPVYSLCLCIITTASLAYARHISFITALKVCGVALPVHFVAVVYFMLPKATTKDGVAKLLSKLKGKRGDKDMQLQASRALAILLKSKPECRGEVMKTEKAVKVIVKASTKYPADAAVRYTRLIHL